MKLSARTAGCNARRHTARCWPLFLPHIGLCLHTRCSAARHSSGTDSPWGKVRWRACSICHRLYGLVQPWKYLFPRRTGSLVHAGRQLHALTTGGSLPASHEGTLGGGGGGSLGSSGSLGGGSSALLSSGGGTAGGSWSVPQRQRHRRWQRQTTTLAAVRRTHACRPAKGLLVHLAAAI